MSRQHCWLERGVGMLAMVSALLLVAAQPARAWDNHRHHHHHGGGASFSFGFSSGPYYYDPYPYGPAYAYPPAYVYGPPPYAYDGGGYDQEPVYEYQDGAYADSEADAGPYCREFQTTVVIDGQPQSAHGTACQQPDGSWVVVR